MDTKMSLNMEPILPMEPKSSSEIPAGAEWIAQIKWDGVRILTYFDGENVRLHNRKRFDRTLHYPEIAEIGSYCSAESVILDGEVISLGSDGKPSFHEVMRRDGIRRMERVGTVREAVPITYMIFDVLFYNGEWLLNRPFRERYDLLSGLIRPNPRIQKVDSHHNANALFQVMKQQGMEGIVLKKTNSLYKIGAKTDAWLKVKYYRDLIAVIGGYTIGNGGAVNAILLGLYDQDGQLWYIGHTGTGRLSKREWRELTDQLAPTVTSGRPFVNLPERHRDAYWVEPRYTVKVNYAEWTEGRALRQPSIQSFVDVAPEECVFSDDMLRTYNPD